MYTHVHMLGPPLVVTSVINEGEGNPEVMSERTLMPPRGG
jgi:hypothetical protein